jgi:hypothetical protein
MDPRRNEEGVEMEFPLEEMEELDDLLGNRI